MPLVSAGVWFEGFNNIYDEGIFFKKLRFRFFATLAATQLFNPEIPPPSAKIPGRLWVEGNVLGYVDNSGNEWQHTGTIISTPAGAIPGRIWVQVATTNIRYVDFSGNVREISGVNLGAEVGTNGNAWVQLTDNYIHYQYSNTEYRAHADVAHTDNHTDVAHGDGSVHSDSHSDSHTDTAHSDSHTDTAHGDVTHVDSHVDQAHIDSHVDVVGPHVDRHNDLAHVDSHSDTAHTDSAHNDSHGDHAHSDVGHSDSHTDTPAHSDSAHSDTHNDTHTDQPTFIGGAGT